MNGWFGNGWMQDRQRKYFNIETNYKHSKGGYGRLPLAMFTHAMDFFKECASLKKPIL